MMNKAIFFLVLLFSLNSCKGQEENKLKKNNNMEHFDIEKYKGWEIDSTYWGDERDLYYKKNHKKVRITYTENKILLVESNNTPYKTYKNFSLKTKSLLFTGRVFYSVYIGISKHYDGNGNLVEETNEELPYKLSVDDIIKIMKQEYKIDLMDTSLGYSVSRNDNEFPKYRIGIPLGEPFWRVIIINADTGKIVSDTEHNTDDKFRKNKQKKVGLGTPYKSLNDLPAHTHKIFEGIAYTQDEWNEFVSKQSWYWRLMHT